MAKKKKVQRAEVSRACDFSYPMEYFKTYFGAEDEKIPVWILNLKVSDLLDAFKVFEDMNNVQSWPISTLIQRELDHKRATQICDDYLMNQGNTKYFPPLISVLIPTDENYSPVESYGDPVDDWRDAFEQKYFKGNQFYQKNEFAPPVQPFKGVFEIALDDEQGEIAWDKLSLSAVIIDGQHRYKALEKAVERDKNFLNWKLNVTVIDLYSLVKSGEKSPTEAARDLFVTINHTPVEVDETRLVLMDDRDALSTFAQVLVDDSGDYGKPVLPPELIDWECEGAKHSIENSVTGVLTLRQIVLSAFFDDKRISTVEDRSYPKNVKKWINAANTLLNADQVIADRVGKTETLTYRYETALEGQDIESEDDEEGLFLFSYSVNVAKELKREFASLYLNSFRHLFNEIYPFKDIVDLATDHDVLSNGSDLNNYYRSFRGKQKELFKNPEIKSQVRAYENRFQEITHGGVWYTVMGQKALVSALYSLYLSDAGYSDCEIFEKTKAFVDDFNYYYSILAGDGSVQENMFLLEFSQRAREISKAYSVGSDFWRAIVRRGNGEIDYSKTAIGILSSILQDIMCFEEDEEFIFSKHDVIVRRHRRMLVQFGLEDELEEHEIDDLAEKVVRFKEKILQRRLEGSKNS